MKWTILGLLAETPIHPGSGRSTGFVDLPVAREAATDYPVIVGSSVKGALLDLARASGTDEVKAELRNIFGEPERAGALLVSDARLVLLPVRSLTSQYKWVTCPHLIERLVRDNARAGEKESATPVPSVESGKYLGPAEGELFLEERQFAHGRAVPHELFVLLKSLIAHASTAERLEQQLVVLHDGDFAWFARYGLSVNARNVLDKDKKTSQNLWYEETIPPDSLFCSLLAERSDNGALASVRGLFKGKPYIQMGGNETVGQGWFAVKLAEGGQI
jgi:CRISPR-associated protein Cmr4